MIDKTAIIDPKAKVSSNVSIGGVLKGNIKSDKIRIKSSADVDGVLNQKNLSIEDGAKLKIKAETY